MWGFIVTCITKTAKVSVLVVCRPCGLLNDTIETFPWLCHSYYLRGNLYNVALGISKPYLELYYCHGYT